MLVVGTVTVDLNWLFQLIATLIVIAVFLSHLFVKATAASSNFLTMIQQTEQEPEEEYSIRNKISPGSCVICGKDGINQCSACKLVKYCSTACQSSHWKSGHKTECKQFQLFGKCNLKKSTSIQNRWKDSKSVALVPGSIKQAKEILFPYEDFVEFYNCDKAGFPPCGLLNCGNSCFANVVLQCLSSTRPLVVYLLEKGHRKECRRNDWCFLCEFQTHIERASSSRQPFSPLNILSRLPNIGGNLGYGKQEDAHEFMRFAIDTMQSVCLDEFGGEKVLHPSTQETTLIQHIFGGHLQSQVVCSMCRNVSNQCENVMDLTVEIHGDASCLEECLDQFTAREQLHGDNMYKCDGCNDYVMAWKRLMIRRAPNILTIALKRFQSGRFGKLNKRVTFPETLDLRPYMSEEGDGNDVYKLYAVVVHVDMLNASFFGHYVCYTRDLYGNWYRIDDNKVSKVDLEDVLSEGAYMLLYSRVCPRPSCLKPVGSSSDNEEQKIKVVHQEESVEVVQGFPTVKTDLFSSTNISDEMDMAVSITTPSSSLEMDVSISQDSKTEKEYLFSSCAEVENQQRFDISDDVLELSSMENLQCVENSEIVESEQNHQDSNNLSTTADFKTDGDVDTDKGLKSASERNIAIKKSDNRKNLKKPYLTPGFLGKRSGNKSRERCEKVPDDVDMTVSISTPSSSQDMDVPCIWDLKLVKENAFSKCSEVEDQQRTGICDDVLMKDSEIVVSEQNHRDSNNLQNTANSKSDRDKMEIENGLKSPSEEGIAIKMLDKRKNLKPFLTPGFLVKHEKYHCDSISEPNLMEML